MTCVLLEVCTRCDGTWKREAGEFLLREGGALRKIPRKSSGSAGSAVVGLADQPVGWDQYCGRGGERPSQAENRKKEQVRRHGSLWCVVARKGHVVLEGDEPAWGGGVCQGAPRVAGNRTVTGLKQTGIYSRFFFLPAV